MNPIYEKQVFYALNELYLDSVRLDPDLDFDWDDLDCRRGFAGSELGIPARRAYPTWKFRAA
jgi:hypothetical protein